jgi:inorganic pyrophosphatase
VKVFIQNEAGSVVKNMHNEKSLELTGMVRVSCAYPLPYGFILDTTADDGLNVDCFVLTKTPLRSGQVVECEPIGLMEQIENGIEDHNVIAVIQGEDEHLDDRVKQILIQFVRHVFDHIAGKTIQAGAFRDRLAAVEHVSRHQDIVLADID